MISADTYNKLPEKPGVYIFKNAQGDVLYVGKAKNLKKRVASYFTRPQTDRPWIDVMLPTVSDIETTVVGNELEALMLEATLIKQHRPRFNIMLTDDKSYPYIKLVIKEPLPRFAITRRLSKDGARYFGPYLSARAAEHTLEFLRKLYGIHISPRPLLANQDRPCLNCQLDGFTCPLHDEISPETYFERVTSAIDFLEGKRKNLVRDLNNKMTQASEQQQFELAAKLRDRLHSIKRVLEHQQVISTNQEDYDAISAVSSGEVACVTVLSVREGRVTAQKNFFYQISPGEQTAEIVRQFLTGYYVTFAQTPKLVVLVEKIDDTVSVEKLLSEEMLHVIELRVAKRGDKRQIAELATKNAQARLETQLLKTSQSFTGLIALKEILGLSDLPERIEAVDISNLGTSEPVAATVCFINGTPDKNEYRRYKIKTVEGQNDFAMIREVTKRRFSDTSRKTPDLFVVDGGPEQLKFALEALEQAPTRPKNIISLAKKPDRIFKPGKKLPERISRGNKGLLLLARVRDEVHRFGITFQRKRQRRKLLSSAND